MPFMEWDDSFSVGVKKIDDQHKRLLHITTDLYNAMAKGQSRDVMGGVLQELVSYTKEHFRTEEDLFDQTGYPESGLHKTEHSLFVDKAGGYLSDFNEGKPVVSIELLEFLRDWLIGHIKGTDMKYSAFFNEQGIV